MSDGAVTRPVDHSGSRIRRPRLIRQYGKLLRRRGAPWAIFQNTHFSETIARRVRRRPVFRFTGIQTLS